MTNIVENFQRVPLVRRSTLHNAAELAAIQEIESPDGGNDRPSFGEPVDGVTKDVGEEYFGGAASGGIEGINHQQARTAAGPCLEDLNEGMFKAEFAAQIADVGRTRETLD
jgi:hypothetical protein